MSRPLRSAPITGASSLLRADPSLCPVSVLSLSTVGPLEVFPSHRDDRFPRSVLQPTVASRRLYAGGRMPSNQVSGMLCPDLDPGARFRPHVPLSTPHQRFTFVRLSTAYLSTSRVVFSETLTTTTLNRSSFRWFETCSCKPIPRSDPGSNRNFLICNTVSALSFSNI